MRGVCACDTWCEVRGHGRLRRSATGSAAGGCGRECEAYAMKVRETLNFNSDEEAAMVEEIYNNAMGCLGGADRELEVGQPPSACLWEAAARVTRACSSMQQARSRELPAHAVANATRLTLSLQASPGMCAWERGLVKAHSKVLRRTHVMHLPTLALCQHDSQCFRNLGPYVLAAQRFSARRTAARGRWS